MCAQWELQAQLQGVRFGLSFNVKVSVRAPSVRGLLRCACPAAGDYCSARARSLLSDPPLLVTALCCSSSFAHPSPPPRGSPRQGGAHGWCGGGGPELREHARREHPSHRIRTLDGLATARLSADFLPGLRERRAEQAKTRHSTSSLSTRAHVRTRAQKARILAAIPGPAWPIFQIFQW